MNGLRVKAEKVEKADLEAIREDAILWIFRMDKNGAVQELNARPSPNGVSRIVVINPDNKDDPTVATYVVGDDGNVTKSGVTVVDHVPEPRVAREVLVSDRQGGVVGGQTAYVVGADGTVTKNGQALRPVAEPHAQAEVQEYVPA